MTQLWLALRRCFGPPWRGATGLAGMHASLPNPRRSPQVGNRRGASGKKSEASDLKASPSVLGRAKALVETRKSPDGSSNSPKGAVKTKTLALDIKGPSSPKSNKVLEAARKGSPRAKALEVFGLSHNEGWVLRVGA